MKVTNPATAPVFFANVNDPGRMPYQSLSSSNLCANECNVSFPVVPVNSRLVVQHFSGQVIALVTATDNWFVSLLLPSGPVSSVITQQPVSGLSQGPAAFFDQSTLAYFDAGQSPTIHVRVGPSENHAGLANLSITGYLLDCAVAPCAAIVH
jgi:hypothetical protein